MIITGKLFLLVCTPGDKKALLLLGRHRSYDSRVVFDGSRVREFHHWLGPLTWEDYA